MDTKKPNYLHFYIGSKGDMDIFYRERDTPNKSWKGTKGRRNKHPAHVFSIIVRIFFNLLASNVTQNLQ